MKLFEKSSICKSIELLIKFVSKTNKTFADLSIIIILLEATIAYTSSSGCSKSLTDNNSTINKENCSKGEITILLKT